MSDTIGGSAWPRGAIVIDYISATIRRAEPWIADGDSDPTQPDWDRQAALRLQAALLDGRVGARGLLISDAAETVPAEFWRYAFPEPDGSAINISSGGKLHWYEVCAADVLAIWPAVASPANADASGQEKAVTPDGLSKSKGGRPTTYDWDAAIQESIRLGNSPDGIQSRRQLTLHLQAWFAKQDQYPTDSVLRDRVSRWCPTEIPDS